LEVICLKCLEKAPARRYPSAGALADDLGRFLSGQSIHARPTPPWHRPLRWLRRHAAAACLLLITLASLALAVSLWRLRPAAPAGAGDHAQPSVALFRNFVKRHGAPERHRPLTEEEVGRHAPSHRVPPPGPHRQRDPGA